MLQVNVAQLHEDNCEALALAWVAGRAGRTSVRRESVAAAALIGHLNLTHPNSVQVVGAFETGSIDGLAERLFAPSPAAVIFADSVPPPPGVQDGAERTGTPLFTTPLPPARVSEPLGSYLAKRLAALPRERVADLRSYIFFSVQGRKGRPARGRANAGC